MATEHPASGKGLPTEASPNQWKVNNLFLKSSEEQTMYFTFFKPNSSISSYFLVFSCSFNVGHYQPIGFLPVGARNIQIKEIGGFKNYLGEKTEA